MIGSSLRAFAVRVFAAMVGGRAFLLALVFVFTAGSQAIAQTMIAPNITSEGPFLVDEGETAVATLTADDSDTATSDLIWTNTGGADSAKFSLTSAGVLTFSSAKDYEAPDDADADGTYEVTVQVSDGSDLDSADLVVTLENVVELTALSGPSTVDYEENRAVRVATYSASSEADQDGLTWSLSGADADSFRIDEPAEVLRFDLAVVSPNLFSPPPDYDAPADADSDGTYEVTVEVGDGVTSHSLAVEVTITDQDEAGTLTLSTTRPQFGVTLTTTLTDPDGVTGTVTYQWERSVGRSAWTDIVVATASSYTLTSAETGRFLRVTATYMDGHDSGKTATARTSEVVTADLLSGLTVSTTDSAANSGHALRPSFDADILHYSIGCAAAGETMTLTPTAGSGVRLSIDGTQVPSGESHTVDVDADSEVRVTLAGASGAATTYFVRCLSGNLLDMTVTTATGATGVIEDLIMFGVAKGNERSIAIVDSNGAVRFHRMDANWSGGYVRAAWVSAAGAYRYAYYKAGAGKDWKILDQNLEVIASVATVAPLTDTNRHDITLLDDGNYIVMAYEPVDRDLSELTFGTFGTSVRMQDSAIQIRTPDGTPLLTWSSHDAIPFEDCKPKFPPGHADYAHINTLQMVDGHIVASFRGCNSVLRIDPDDASSHKVVWRLGLTNLSDEQWDGLGKGPPPLEIIGDAEGQFCGQHGAQLLPSGNLLLYDNGVLCMRDPWLNTKLLPRPGGKYSRAVEYALDVDNNEAVFLRDHSLGGTRSKAGDVHGHVEALPNGDWLIGWGEQGPRKPTESVTQVDPDTGEEKFSIVLLQADGGSESIRPIPLPPAALADDPVSLRAEFLDSGTSSFHAQGGPRPTVVIAFNQPVADFENDTSSLGVQGATVDSVDPYFVTGESAHAYRITLIPDSAASISIGLLAGQNCAGGGICTADGGELVEALAARTIYPAVTASFVQATYDAPEGGSIQIALMLSSDPERTIEIPLTFTEQGGASSADYSGIRDKVTFNSGETSKSLTFTATDDTVDDDDESVKLGFQSLPMGVTAGSTTEATVSITDDDTPDTTAPTVSSLTITSNPGSDQTYAAGDEIEVTVTFDETVEVTGTPQLSLELGGGSRTATYGGGSATAALVFEYEVADGESDTDGVGIEADSLSGGTIEDEADNNAELGHDGVAADSGHKVDAVKPELAATGGVVVDGTTLTLTYDEALDGSSTPATGGFTVSGGDRVRTVTGVRVNGSAVELTLDVGAEHGEAGIQVSYTPGANPIRDVPGNEAEALSREPVTPVRPNILLIFTDDQSHRTVGAYPEAYNWVNTPAMDSLASQGVRFEYAYIGTWCMPSRATLLTGRHQFGVESMRMVGPYPGSTYDPEKTPFWPKVFRENGYFTAQIGKWHTGTDTGYGRDWDFQIVWNRPKYPETKWNYYYNQPITYQGGETEVLERYSTDQYTDWAVDLINGNGRDESKPWYLWLNYAGVHKPFTPADRHSEEYTDVSIETPADVFPPRPGKPAWAQRINFWERGPAGTPMHQGRTLTSWTRQYHQAVRSLDEGIARVLEALEESGQRENTLVIFTSDQGMAWGQHGFRGHKTAAYDANIRVPLVISFPGRVPEGRSARGPVAGVDLVPTMFRFAGIDLPWTMHGEDLTPLLEDPDRDWPHPVLLTQTDRKFGSDTNVIPQDGSVLNGQGVPWYVMLVESRYKYVRPLVHDLEELYDLVDDPEELDNLAIKPEFQGTLARMRALAIAELREDGAGFVDSMPPLDLLPDGEQRGDQLGSGAGRDVRGRRGDRGDGNVQRGGGGGGDAAANAAGWRRAPGGELSARGGCIAGVRLHGSRRRERRRRGEHRGEQPVAERGGYQGWHGQ